MGNGSINKTPIKKNELMEMKKITLFNSDIIITFYNFFKKFSSKIKDDGVIDYNEFLSILKLHDNSFSKHLFYSFDQNKDNCINFREFLKFFSVFENGKTLSQCELCFKLFSNPQTNKIERETLINIIQDAISSHEILKTYLTQKDIENIVNYTMEKYKVVISHNNIINNSTFGNLINVSSCDKTIENNTNVNKLLKQQRLTVNSLNTNFYNQGSSNCNNSLTLIDNNENLDEISYEAFQEIINNEPNLINWININVDKLKNFNKKNNSCCF
jgi:Ca2+-binding EF-hand superfamily protein